MHNFEHHQELWAQENEMALSIAKKDWCSLTIHIGKEHTRKPMIFRIAQWIGYKCIVLWLIWNHRFLGVEYTEKHRNAQIHEANAINLNHRLWLHSGFIRCNVEGEQEDSETLVALGNQPKCNAWPPTAFPAFRILWLGPGFSSQLIASNKSVFQAAG